MTPTDTSIQSIKTTIEELLEVMDLMGQVPGLSDPELKSFQDLCRTIPEMLDSGRVKVAVVGVIKSGKSTFINAPGWKRAGQKRGGRRDFHYYANQEREKKQGCHYP